MGIAPDGSAGGFLGLAMPDQESRKSTCSLAILMKSKRLLSLSRDVDEKMQLEGLTHVGFMGRFPAPARRERGLGVMCRGESEDSSIRKFADQRSNRDLPEKSQIAHLKSQIRN